jgi:hypothetical protein
MKIDAVVAEDCLMLYGSRFQCEGKISIEHKL